MCGIAGIINGADRETLERMVEKLRHRGPDDQGIWWDEAGRSGLGHRRLSIIDLTSAGHQPMANADGSRLLSYNGEIYNYREIRSELEKKGHRFRSQSDTEVLLAAYDEWGPDCVRRCNGMFAFAVYDTRDRSLFIARDHLGIKPLYYTQRGELFAFASEAKALFEIEGVERSVDFDGVIGTLLFLWGPEPKTACRNILKLEPGHYAQFRNGNLSITQYWDVPLGETGGKERPEEDYVEELRELLEQAVRRQMVSDVPVGAFLSGGLDSSLITALMRKVNNGRIDTYTIAFSEQDKRMEAMPDDARYAAQVARLFGTEHHEIEADPDINRLLPFILYHLDEPTADGAAINTYLIARGARERGTIVLLNGMGGDEVFGGYRKQRASLLLQQYQRLPKFLRHGLIEPLVNALPVAVGGRGIRLIRWAKRFLRSGRLDPLDAFIYGFAYFSPEELRHLLTEPYASTPFEEFYPIRRYRELAAATEGLPLVERMTYLDTKLFLPGLNLLYSDKGAMAASVETRPPLIDRELVEFAARLPARYKINGDTQKYLLKRAAEAYLPKEIIYRPKAAFGTPIRAWMKSGLEVKVREMFERPDGAFREYLHADFPLQMLREHGRGSSDNAHRLWGVYTLAEWLEEGKKR